MLRSLVRVRAASRFGVLLPFFLAASGCSDSGEGDDDRNDMTAGTAGVAGDDASGNAGAGGVDPAGAGGEAGSAGTVGSGSGGSRAGDEDDDDLPDDSAGLGPEPVDLGDAGEYAVLAQAAISNIPTSVVTGALGLSPAAASYITGFALTRAGTMWTSPEVLGGVFAADNDPATPAALTAAIGDMLAAYDDAANRPEPAFENLGDGAIGGLTLAPGLYKWTSTVTISSEVTLSGAADDVWIFQVSGDLSLDAAQRMSMSGGARAKNVFWQVAGVVAIASTAHAEGIVLGKTAISMGSGSSINGRLLAQTAVTLASTSVTAPAP
jgi:hypothetical protein